MYYFTHLPAACCALYKTRNITVTRINATSGYSTMVHGRECNPHRCTTTSQTWKLRHYDVIDAVITRKVYEIDKNGDRLSPWNPLSYPMVKTASLYDNFSKIGNDVIYDVIIWVQDGNCKKWLERILVLVRSTTELKIRTIRSKL